MGNYQYKTEGACSQLIQFTLEDGKLHNVNFIGGCNGNLKAISKLVEGKSAEEVAQILEGNTCGMRSTSCADQLSKAIRAAERREAEKQNQSSEKSE